MREIKFRAWLEGEMLSNEQLVQKDQNTTCVFTILTENPQKDDVVFMQYTGLKDRNGKEIYEGDIVQIKGHALQRDERGIGIDIDGNYVVKWSKKMELILSVSLEDDDGWLLNRNVHYAEVIGNIYEHKHLLEVDS